MTNLYIRDSQINVSWGFEKEIPVHESPLLRVLWKKFARKYGRKFKKLTYHWVVKSKVHDVLLLRNSAWISYYELCKKSQDRIFCNLDRVLQTSLTLHYPDGEVIPLPDFMRKNFETYLSEINSDYKNLLQYDCMDFLLQILWFNIPKGVFMRNFDYYEFPWVENLRVWDAIMINSKSVFGVAKWEIHVWIYLWRWLFLSKYDRGNIYFTSYEEMRKQYPYEVVSLMMPINWTNI